MPWVSPTQWEEPERTLGWQIADWAEAYLRVPGGAAYGQPLSLSGWQLRALADWYAVGPDRRWLYRRGQIRMAKGSGKALAIDTPVPTPDGWSTMANLRPGDRVFHPSGRPVNVVAATEVMVDHECFRVTFSDGANLVADAGHLWQVEELAAKYATRVVTTRELRERLSLRADGAKNFRVPMPAPVEYERADLPVDPYVLGIWLGDGERNSGRITTADIEVVESIRDAGYEVRKVSGKYRWSVQGLLVQLRGLGVLNLKHVPKQYLEANVKQRVALLQGLMDSDGHIGRRNGAAEFCSTDEPLVDGVCELLASLGVKFYRRESRASLYGKDCGARWRIMFQTGKLAFEPCRLQRKLDNVTDVSSFKQRPGRGVSGGWSDKRHVVAVEPIDSVPVRCIQVDAADGMYLAGDRFVPTHNSPLAAVIAIAELCGPVVFDGVDTHGDPVGRPRPAPWVQIAAVSEEQGQNTYGALHAMLADSSLLAEAGIDLGVTRTVLRGRPGRLDVVTASAGSREGQPITAALLDETHLWTRTNGGRKLHATMLRNASKMGARILATTNAWVPGDESVAEQVEVAASQAPGIMVYGPQFEATVADITDPDALRAGLQLAYADCPWVDVERILVDCQDPDMTGEDVARFHLNRPAASDAVLCAAPTLDDSELEAGAPIALGFDGSRTRDATAVVAIHMESGVAHLLGYWERPIGLPRRSTWEVPRGEVASTIDEAFKRWRVVRMKVDPSHWQDELASWQQTHGPAVDRMPVWQTSIVDRATEAAQTGLSAGALLLSSRPESAVLVAHVQRAQVLRRQIGSRTIRTLAKPDDATRIDAAAALVYASQARLEALAKGWEMTDTAPAPEPFAVFA